MQPETSFTTNSHRAQLNDQSFDLRLQIKQGLGLLLAGFSLLLAGFLQFFFQPGNAHLKLLDLLVRLIVAEQARLGLSRDNAQSGKQ